MSDSSALRTVFYSAMLTSCAIVCVVQCVTQFNLYWSEPAAMTVTIEKGERVLFPAFTACPSLKFSRSRTEAMGVLNRRGTDVDWNLFPANLSVEAFWRRAGAQLDQLVYSCNRGACKTSGSTGGAAPAGRWTSVVGRNGMCYTFTANKTLVVKNEEKLDILFSLSVNDYFVSIVQFFVDVYFHGSEPVIVHSNFFNVADHPKVKLIPGDITNVDITGRQAVFKSLNRRHCRKQLGYTDGKCKERCMWSHQAQMLGCRAPWMSDLPLPQRLCNTTQEYKRMQNLPAIPRGTVSCPHCQTSCEIQMYQVQVSSSQNVAGMARSGKCKLLARWPYQIELSTEEVTYGLSGLISDVGGNMSLLLGVSVISIVQSTEALLLVVRARVRGLRRRRPAKVAPPQPPPPPARYASPPSRAGESAPHLVRVVSGGPKAAADGALQQTKIAL